MFHGFKTVSNKEFTKRLQDRGQNIIALSKYTRCSNNIKFKCLVCNFIWSCLPSKILTDYRCINCSLLIKEEKQAKIFMKRVKKEHKGYFKFTTPYMGLTKPLTAICKYGHTVTKNAGLFKSGGDTTSHGCKECHRKEVAKKLGMGIENLRKKLKEVHGDKIVCLSKTYKNNLTLMKFKCDNGHTFMDKAGYIIYNHGCQQCLTYKLYSKISIEFLNAVAKKSRIRIQHGENTGEYKIPSTRYKADGYNKRLNIVFEFHGSHFHGSRYNSSSYHNKNAYEKTLNRDRSIKKLGYNLISVWDIDYNKDKVKTIEKVTLKIQKIKDKMKCQRLY